MSSPLVSIMVPVHNRRVLLADCLKSALAQTRRDIEVVVVENASTDGTWDVCRAFARADSRVRIFRNPENIGPVRNWQRCFREAEGRFGKLLFSDDVLASYYLEKTIPLLHDPHVAFVFTMAMIGPGPRASRLAHRFDDRTGRFTRQHYIRRALFGSRAPVSPGAALFRIKDLRLSLRLSIPSPTIDDFERHGAGIDLLLYLMTAARYEEVAYVAEPLVFFRAHEGSISHAARDSLLIDRLSSGAYLVRRAYAGALDAGLDPGRRVAQHDEAQAAPREPGLHRGSISAGGSRKLDPMKLGIVTISFNQAKYLAEAIESVYVADPERLEYVIVDPGSTDGSREIIESYRRRFSRVMLEPDQGPPDGLNKGFAALDADILGYLNSDDRFAPGALDYVLRYFERHPSVDALCGAIRIIGEDGRSSLRRRTPDPIDLRRYAYETCFFWQQATFFRREAFLKTGGFNVASKTTWDGELVVDMALAGCRFAYTNKLLGDFRVYGDSITGSGRLNDALRRDRQNMREKILRAGVPRASGLEVRVMKYLYKFNLRRHWSYLFDSEELEAPQ